MFKINPLKRVLFPRTLTTFVLGVLSMSTILYGGFSFHPQKTYAATSSTINFQARLQGASGNIAPDGFYNIQFKLYSASSGGSALWTESYYDANGATAGSDNRVKVANGYVSVALGSQAAFGAIDWDQKLYLTMNVGGTTQTATPTYDGEMSPRLSLTAVPYAFTAGQLATSDGTYASRLGLVQPTVGNQSFQIADQAAAGTYTLCVQGAVNANGGCAASTGAAGYIQNQNSGAQSTSNFYISGTGRADTALQAPAIDVGSAGTLTIANTNATTLNVATNAIAHTINIGTGAAAQDVTIGSQNSTSSTTIQGGSGGIGLHAASGTSIGFYNGAQKTFELDTAGRATFKSNANDVAAFRVQNAAGTENVFYVDTSSSLVSTCDACALQVGSSGITTTGALSFSGTASTSYVTPGGASIPTKINIANYDPGSFGQVLALGLASSAQSTARVITVADQRAAGHQASIAVLSPNENQIGGLSWDGSNTSFGITTTTSTVAIQNSGGIGLSTTVSGTKQITAVGTASSTSGVLQFNNETNGNNVSLQATSVSTSYSINLPTAIGTAGQCLKVASVASTTAQLGFDTCGTAAVSLQGSSPGTPDTGNINISGVGIFGAGVLASSLDTASAGTLTVGGTTATTINVGNNAAAHTVNIATGAAAQAVTIGSTNSTSGLTLQSGSAGISLSGATTATGNFTVGSSAGSGTTLTNNGATVNSTLALSDISGGGAIGTAAATVDIYTSVSVAQTTTGKTLTVPTPTANTAYGRLLYLSNIGTQNFTLLGTPLKPGATASLIWSNTNGAASWQYAGSDGNGILNQSGSTQTADFNISGTGVAGVLQAATFDTASAGTLAVGTANATTINIGTNASAHTIAIGNGAAVQGVTIGSTNGASATTLQAGTGNLNLLTNSASASVIVKSGTNATTAFQIQNSSNVGLFTADTSAGTITIGSSGNTATFASTGEMTLAGTARHAKKLILTPEYAGAVMDAAGDTGGSVNCNTTNNGTMTSGFVATGRQNYYNWTSSQASAQCYDVVLQVQLPSDWAAWNGASSLFVYNSVGTDSTSVAVNVIDTTGTNDTAYSATSYNGVSSGTTFASTNLTGYTGTYAADGYMTVKIRMTSNSSKNVRIGNLTLNYYSKY